MGSTASLDAEDYATEPEEGTNWGAAAMGALGLGAAGLLLHQNPGTLSKIYNVLAATRMQSMLSGLAVPKSILGNVGAGIEQAVEGKGFGALKSLFSRETLDDAIAAYKANQGMKGGMNLPGPMPGRIMGALDDASQKAFMRSGMSEQEAQRALMQTPLGENFGKFGEALDSPVANYVFPFRRVPFNQMAEGLTKLKGADAGTRRGLAVYGTVGAVHGAATADDDTPMSIPMAMAGSARYGLPYGLAALAGRALAGGKVTGSGIAGSMLPVSEYGVEAAFDPLRPFIRSNGKGGPAALTALDRLFGGE